jgi:hypothetical protein
MKDLQSLKEHIKKYVTLGDLLRNEGKLLYNLDEEQIHCPFHGEDRRKSARYYKSTDDIYCWKCKKIWDIFSYLQQSKGISLGEAINSLVQTYRIDISSVPEQMEVLIKGVTGTQRIEIDRKKVFLMQVYDYLIGIRDKVDFEKFRKLAFSYMILKCSITDEKFTEASGKLNEALIRVTKEINNG